MIPVYGFVDIDTGLGQSHLGGISGGGIGNIGQVNTAGIRGITVGCRRVGQVFSYGRFVIVNQYPRWCQRLVATDQGQAGDVDSEITVINGNSIQVSITGISYGETIGNRSAVAAHGQFTAGI